jgi:hypothetical protein
MVVFGVLLIALAFGMRHWRGLVQSNRSIEEGHVKADRGLVILVTVLVVLLTGGIITFMLLTE